MRTAQPFPNLGPGTSQVTFPKRNDSYRVVSVTATITRGAPVLGQQVLLAIIDGAGNAIASWPSIIMPGAGFVESLTWSNAGAGTAVAISAPISGQVGHVEIAPDVWVLPQWTLQLSINPNDGADNITAVVLQADTGARSKKQIASAEDAE